MKLRNKILFGVILPIIFVNVIFGLVIVFMQKSKEDKRLDTKINYTIEIVQQALAKSVKDIETKKVEAIMQGFLNDNEIVGIKVVDITNEINLSLNVNNTQNSNLISKKLVIVWDNEIFGNGEILFTHDIVDENINTLIRNTITLTLLVTLIMVVVVVLISRIITQPITQIINGINKVEEKDYNYELKINSKDEFKNIELFFNKMVRTIKMDIDLREKSSQELENSNIQLIKEIAEREKAEKALSKSEELYRLIANNATDMIAQTTIDGIFIYVSSASLQLIGFAPNELLNMNSFFFVHPNDMLILRTSHEKVLSQIGTVDTITFRMKKKDGRYTWIETSNKAIGDSKMGDLKITSVLRDITERKKYQEELEKAKLKAEESDLLKSAFLANMSHEIRTPMNGILGFSELLSKPNVNDEKKDKYIRFINKSSHELLTIINDILDISKIEANQLNILEIETDLHGLLADLQSFYNEQIIEQKKSKVRIELKFGISENECTIYTDAVRLRQVVSNLLGNAVKFTHEGVIQMSVELKEPNILIAVKDTGIGIPPEMAEVVFERFRQVDSSSTRKYGGTGLGLPICKGIINLLGGDIWMESQVGKGSIFYFTIPYKPVINLPKRTNELATKRSLYHWADKSILVAEDDVASFIYLSEILAETNVKIIHAKDGSEAINIMSQSPQIDIILMDMQMPKINGYEATRRIKAIRNDIPIIAQTANAMVDDREKCLSAGCIDYMPKPIRPDILFRLLNKYM